MTVDKAFESTLLPGKTAAMMSAITVRGCEIMKQKSEKKGWKRASRVLNEKKQCNQQLESALIWYYKPRDLESQFTAISSWENSSIKKNRCRK